MSTTPLVNTSQHVGTNHDNSTPPPTAGKPDGNKRKRKRNSKPKTVPNETTITNTDPTPEIPQTEEKKRRTQRSSSLPTITTSPLSPVEAPDPSPSPPPPSASPFPSTSPATPSSESHPVNPPFSSLGINELTQKALVDMGFSQMTPIQASTIPHALLGEDVVASAKSGAGKTLSYLIPAIELLVKGNYKAKDGTVVLAVVPSREIAIQTYEVTRELMKYHSKKTFGIVTGGVPKQPEDEKLRKGMNFLIGTPGRILEHIANTIFFNLKNIKMVILDNTDRLLNDGFEKEIISIVKAVPKPTQTIVLASTHSTSLQHIVNQCELRKPFEFSIVHPLTPTPASVSLGYVLCDLDKRFVLLYSFLKRNTKQKIIVIFSSCAATTYFSELLTNLDMLVLSLNTTQEQAKKAATLLEFKNTDHGVLLSSEVAARGFELPEIDWFIQFDPPEDIKEYINRVGSIPRVTNGRGNALHIMLPSERLLIPYLNELGVTCEAYQLPTKLDNIQGKIEKLVGTVYYLNISARGAYNGYLRAYGGHPLKNIYDVRKIDLTMVSKCLGLDVVPRIDLKAISKTSVDPGTLVDPTNTKQRRIDRKNSLPKFNRKSSRRRRK